MAKKASAVKLLTVTEVAARLDVARPNIRKWVREGRFEGAELNETPVGSYWLIPESAVKAFKARPVGRPKVPKLPVKAKRANKKRSSK